jgi:hypothetical protein
MNLPGPNASRRSGRTGPSAVEPTVSAFVKELVATGKPVASICHGPWMLVEADVVRGRRFTSWPSTRTDLSKRRGGSRRRGGMHRRPVHDEPVARRPARLLRGNHRAVREGSPAGAGLARRGGTVGDVLLAEVLRVVRVPAGDGRLVDVRARVPTRSSRRRSGMSPGRPGWSCSQRTRTRSARISGGSRREGARLFPHVYGPLPAHAVVAASAVPDDRPVAVAVAALLS